MAENVSQDGMANMLGLTRGQLQADIVRRCRAMLQASDPGLAASMTSLEWAVFEAGAASGCLATAQMLSEWSERLGVAGGGGE